MSIINVDTESLKSEFHSFLNKRFGISYFSTPEKYTAITGQNYYTVLTLIVNASELFNSFITERFEQNSEKK